MHSFGDIVKQVKKTGNQFQTKNNDLWQESEQVHYNGKNTCKDFLLL